jgi:MGT family glycosyltransferase
MSRFLFATMPIVGHVAPIAPVARELINRGHEVTWYTSKYFEDKITATGATLAPLVSPIDFGDGEYNKHFPGRDKYHGLRQVVYDFEHVFVGSVEGYVDDLRTLIDSDHPDALVVDPAVAAGVILSIVDGVPTATIGISVLALQDAYQAPFGLGLPPRTSLLGRLRNKALYPLIDHVIFRRVNRASAALAKKHDWPYFPFRPKATDFLFIQPSVESFEYPRANTPPQVHFVGPLMPELSADSPRPAWWADLETARESGRPIILVTQGTIATDSMELIQPTLDAMEFEDVFVVAAGVDPATLPAIPANARVERFVPFRPLMPLIDGYVTNGGFGGVTIALANGVPVVSGGTTEDKAEVGGRVAYTGVGINLKTSRPTVERLRTAIFSILRDPSYRQRAAEIQRDLATHDGPAEAAQLLEQLAATRKPVLRSDS